MDISVAQRFLAACKVTEQNQQYDNPAKDSVCTCQTCQQNPRPPRPQTCNCSGCLPETVSVTPAMLPTSSVTSAPSTGTEADLPQPADRISKAMRERGVKHLQKLRVRLMHMSASCQTFLLPHDVFLTNNDI